MLGVNWNMNRNGFWPSLTFAGLLVCSIAAFACECGAPGPACDYVSHASAVFIGTPVYTNDNGSGTFLQQTLDKFEVDEIFKGLPEATKEVWVDPGSFTSCYAEYEIGKKLLVFAYAGKAMPVDSAAMTVGEGGKPKPLPPGFDPGMPVYYAPECSGTRPAESAAEDIDWLRSWKKGETHTRIYGTVVDGLDAPLKGASVTVKGESGSLTTTSDVDGAWSFDKINPGKYDLSAEFPKSRLWWAFQPEVENGACSFAKLRMVGTGSISGIAVGANGEPIGGIEIQLATLSGEVLMPMKAAADGSFNFIDLSAGDYLVGVNLRSPPSTDMPYERTYLPGVSTRQQAQILHLEQGGKLSVLRVRVPPRMKERTLLVQVKWPNGANVGAHIAVFAEGESEEDAETNADGVAALKLLTSMSYKVSAQLWLSKPGDVTARRVVSPPTQINAGENPVRISVVLSQTKVGFDDSSE